MNTRQRPMIVGVGGFTSEVGKTTLLCNLLRAFPGWEAIKTTRGHYRSCGKDPEACCVSHLLADEPVVRSGRELTYEAGKDTGRYWDAGATNVHWLIATDDQIAGGIKQALARVEAPGVFVEGNSFTQTVDPDFFIMVARADDLKIKQTARRALNRASAFYLSGESEPNDRQRLDAFLAKYDYQRSRDFGSDVDVFSRRELPQLINRLGELNRVITASSREQTHLASHAS